MCGGDRRPCQLAGQRPVGQLARGGYATSSGGDCARLRLEVAGAVMPDEMPVVKIGERQLERGAA